MRRRHSTRRLVAFGVVVALGLGLVLLRLVWLQGIQSARWRAAALEQSTHEESVIPRRGTLLDRNGKPLALSERRTRVGVTRPDHWLEPPRTKALASALGLSPRALRERLRGRDGHVVVHPSVALSPALRDSLGHHPTVTFETQQERVYPLGPVGRRLMGRVGPEQRGDAGLERVCDERLRGVPGRELVRRAGGLRRDTIMRLPLERPVEGSDVLLTVDLRLQMILENELEQARERSGATSAMGVVLQPWTGEVLALAELPWPDPEGSWRNPGLVDSFEPGSTFKLFTVASMLRRAVCDTATIFDGEGQPGDRRSAARLDGLTIHDVHPVGLVSLRHAFVVSSNIVMAKAVRDLRPHEFHDDLRAFGFGARPGTDWPAETAGLLREVQQWSRRTQSTLAIGQEIGVSLLQLASGYAALLTDGTLRPPRFVRGWRDAQGRLHEAEAGVTRRRVVPPSLVPTLRALCREVVQQDYGTGAAARVEGLDVGGKTGTAQISGPHGYLPGQYSASFVGFAPVDRPRLLIAIVLHGAQGEQRWGGVSAAPCFAKVLTQVAASTEWLDDGALPVEEELAVVPARMPDLMGKDAHLIQELAEAGGWVLTTPPPPGALAVGQLPRPGTPLRAGAPVHVAWTDGGEE